MPFISALDTDANPNIVLNASFNAPIGPASANIAVNPAAAATPAASIHVRLLNPSFITFLVKL